MDHVQLGKMTSLKSELLMIHHTITPYQDTTQWLIFYFDGEEIRRQTNVFCNSPVNVYLSLALLDSVGDPTDEDSGKYMEVDYVRVYAEK